MWKCTYIETSAKKNFNIESIFEVKRTRKMQIRGKQEIRKYFSFQEILELEQQRALYLQSEEEKVAMSIQDQSEWNSLSLFPYKI